MNWSIGYTQCRGANQNPAHRKHESSMDSLPEQDGKTNNTQVSQSSFRWRESLCVSNDSEGDLSGLANLAQRMNL